MTFNKYQIQLNPNSIIGHRYPAILSPLQFTVKLLRAVQINSMELVKLWANLDVSIDKRQWTQVVTVEFWLNIRKNLTHSQALEQVAQRDVASPSLKILKLAGQGFGQPVPTAPTWSKQQVGLETPKTLVHPRDSVAQSSSP